MLNNITEASSASANGVPKRTWSSRCDTPMKMGTIPRHLAECASSGATAGSLSADGENSNVRKKRSRVSKTTPTVVLDTDVYNFREMVQRYTGCEANTETGNPKRPFFFKPMPQRAVHQNFSDNLHTSFNDSGPCPLPPQTSFPPMFAYQAVIQPNKNPFLLQSLMNDKTSNGIPHGETANLCFDEFLNELGQGTSVF